MSFKREQHAENIMPALDEDVTERELCRDFKNGHCSRGERCRFDHPKLNVCRDFQNGKCTRGNCRFLHVTCKQEEIYAQSGHFPSHNSSGMKGLQGGSLDFKELLGKRKFEFSPMPISYGQNHISSHDLCRDFEKGECTRGGMCKYYHPKLIICRDFQNEKCKREKCRFLHMTCEEVGKYDSSGIVPDHLNKEEVKKRKVKAPSSVIGVGSRAEINGKRKREDIFDHIAGLSLNTVLQDALVPQLNFAQTQQQLCHDFEKGDCSRGDRCKYQHPKLLICRDFQNEKCERGKCRFLHMTREEEEEYKGSGIVPDHLDKEELKKKKLMPSASTGGERGGINEMHGNVDHLGGVPNSSFAAALQENVELKLKITEMQQRLTDLRKMNDALYEQNTNYRKYRKLT